VVELSRAQQSPGSWKFGPLDVPGAARVVLILTWSAQETHLEVNGINVPLAGSNLPPISLSTVVSGPAPKGTALQLSGATAAVTDDERLFLDTLRDIDAKAIARDRYSLIRASGLLRQLLLDGFVHRINRGHRARIEFTTINFTTSLPGAPTRHWRNLDPSPFPGASVKTCNLDQFLAAPCLRWEGVQATVRDLISACANAKGGVHLGRARTEKEQRLLDWDLVFSVMGEEPSVAALAGICRVTLVGLGNLAAAVAAGSSRTRR